MAQNGAVVVARPAFPEAHVAAAVRNDARFRPGFDRFAAVAPVLSRHVRVVVLTGGATPTGLHLRRLGPGTHAVQVEDVVALGARPDLVVVLDHLTADEALEHFAVEHLFQAFSL